MHVVDDRVNLAPDGKEALLKLSKGDMRRALNVLQACHAAYDLVDETAVYNCTGNPHPKDVEAVVQSMMLDEFSTSYECACRHSEPLTRRGAAWREADAWPTDTVITQLKIDRGLALQDLIAGAYEVLETIELPKQSRIYLLDHLATCE